jgi:hypothetical protein
MLAACVSATDLITEETERLLSLWVEDQTRKKSCAGFYTIKEKVLSVYADLKEGRKP